MSGIRSNVKAIIINDGKILLNKCCDGRGTIYYTLPGGGQEKFEEMSSSLVRECLEETGYTVKVERFIGMIEEINTNKDFIENYPQYSHKINHLYLCSILSKDFTNPTCEDDIQIGTEFIQLCDIENIKIHPEMIGECFKEILNSTGRGIFTGIEYTAFNPYYEG